MLSYCLTCGDGIGWAIDEDARLLRRALKGAARERPAPFGEVVHSPFWMGLEGHSPEVLARRFVLAQADNPPFFYLTQPEFAYAQVAVGEWVARSREAKGQFEALGLRACHVPYAIDEAVFRPAPDREGLRRGLGLRPEDFVVGNFHRDTEGADLRSPKFQKAPEIFVWMLRELRAAGVPAVALLAGPRRHWILGRLKEEGIPYVFAGREPGAEDDLRQNILPRGRLAELYTACDVYLIASRWEGGPQSAMEAAACRCPVVSSRVGVALDIFEEGQFFDDPREGVAILAREYRERFLRAGVERPHERCLASHSSRAMAEGIAALYRRLESSPEIVRRARGLWLGDAARELAWRLERRRGSRGGPAVFDHEGGACVDWDARFDAVRAVGAEIGCGARIAGCTERPADVQIGGPGTERFVPDAVVVAGSVEEALDFRKRGCRNPLVVFPFESGAALEGEGPVVVGEGEPHGALKARAALQAGRPVVYPESSALRWLVFYDGVGYGRRRSLSEAVAAASRSDRPGSFRPAFNAGAFFRRLGRTVRMIRLYKEAKG